MLRQLLPLFIAAVLNGVAFTPKVLRQRRWVLKPKPILEIHDVNIIIPCVYEPLCFLVRPIKDVGFVHLTLLTLLPIACQQPYLKHIARFDGDGRWHHYAPSGRASAGYVWFK